MNIDNLKKIISNINDDAWDEYGQFFNNDIELFLNIVDRYGLLELIDPMSNSFNDHENKILFKLIELNPKKYYDYICKTIINNDIEFRDGKYYYVVGNDITDLSSFFKSSYRRNVSSSSIADSVLNGDFWEPYNNTTDDVYRDVIEELTTDNMIEFINKVSSELVGESIPVETDFLEELCEEYESCDGEQIQISADMISKLVSDSNTMKWLLKNYLPEINNELYNIHWNAYNNTYSNEVYELVWNELDTFFVGKPEWKSRKNNEGKEIYWSELQIRDLEEDVYKFLIENYESTSSDDTLSYLGGYRQMILSGMGSGIWDELDFNVPDYPNYRDIDKNINSYFKDNF
jgi:hypothetical protein